MSLGFSGFEFVLCFIWMPVSVGFGVAERSEAFPNRRPGKGRARVGKRRAEQRSRTDGLRLWNGGGSLRVSAGFGETSGEARCGNPQSADRLKEF
jgi:hypothetical protein